MTSAAPTPRTDDPWMCRICGCAFSSASFGGPGICPYCDCGIQPVAAQKARIDSLQRDLAAAEAREKRLRENIASAIEREKRAAAQSKWALDGNSKLRAEIDRLKIALKTVGDDYPGSSCQRWCYQQAGLDFPDAAPAGREGKT